jgi:hypothetical protein
MTVLGITGHQDIPAEARSHIEHGLDALIDGSVRPLTGVSSLAAGADQLFAAALLRHQGRLRVVVPCRSYEQAFGDPAALASYRTLLGIAHTVETLDHDAPSEEAFLDAGRRVADLSDLLIAVWDGEEPRGKGGTADIVRYARARGRHVITLWPAGITRG